MRRASPLPFPAQPLPQSWQSPPPQLTVQPQYYQPNGASMSAPGGGKTSQVIERLTAENDRLRREMKAERAAKEESQQQQRVLRGLVDQLEDKNATLKHQLDTHDGALARKERRIDDLRSQLDQEAKRRRRAEDQEAEMSRKLDEISQDAAKQVAQAKSIAQEMETAYMTLSKEYSSTKVKVDAVQKGFNTYMQNAEKKRSARETTILQLEILLDQKRQAMEQALKANREQATAIEEFRRDFVDLLDRKEEMVETTHKMRWVMGLHRSRAGSLENREPPPGDQYT